MLLFCFTKVILPISYSQKPPCIFWNTHPASYWNKNGCPWCFVGSLVIGLVFPAFRHSFSSQNNLFWSVLQMFLAQKMIFIKYSAAAIAQSICTFQCLVGLWQNKLSRLQIFLSMLPPLISSLIRLLPDSVQAFNWYSCW